MGGLSLASVPCPGAPASLRRRPRRPLGHRRGLTFMPGHHVNFVDLHLTFQRRCWRSGHQPVTQLFGHDLRVGRVQAQLQGDLATGEVEPHEVEAQHPRAQRLVMAGQHRAGEVVEAGCACPAAIALAMGLRVVASVADHGLAVAARAAHALRPAPLAHEGEALGVVQQAGEVDQVGYGHDDGGSSCEPVSYARFGPHARSPPP